MNFDLTTTVQQLKINHDWMQFEYVKISGLIRDIIEESSKERELILGDKEDHQIFEDYHQLHAATTKALILLDWQQEQMRSHLKRNGELTENLSKLTQPAEAYEQAKKLEFCLLRPSC